MATWPKKVLDFGRNKPKLRIPPRPGPGSGGLHGQRKSFHSSGLQPASLFLDNFGHQFHLHTRGSGLRGGLIRRHQPLRAQPRFEQRRPLVERSVALAQTAAVGSIRKDVRLGRNAGLHQRLIEAQTLLDGHRLVVECVVPEGGRRVLGDKQVRRVSRTQRLATGPSG